MLWLQFSLKIVVLHLCAVDVWWCSSPWHPTFDFLPSFLVFPIYYLPYNSHRLPPVTVTITLFPAQPLSCYFFQIYPPFVVNMIFRYMSGKLYDSVGPTSVIAFAFLQHLTYLTVSTFAMSPPSPFYLSLDRSSSSVECRKRTRFQIHFPTVSNIGHFRSQYDAPVHSTLKMSTWL